MKSYIISFLLFAGINLSAEDWKLVWSDEFEYKGLPDKTKWDYEEGFVRNKELQYYTRERKENARVEDGLLVIEARKEKLDNPKYKIGSDIWKENRKFAKYTSASVTTLKKVSWKYGRVEVKAKLPAGKGVWPAIWMMGDVRKDGVRWPQCGEIDIMEFVGKDPNRIHAASHYPIDGKHKSSGGKLVVEKPYADFHIYAIEWSAEKIDYYFDDKKYYSFVVDLASKGEENPFRKEFYLLINFAMGGNWGGDIDDGVLPQKFLVDYVRVYEKNLEGDNEK